MSQRDLDDVIDELGEAMMESIVVPERERVGRTPSAEDLAPPDNDPRVLVDSSLLTDIERRIECKPTLAVGTIPPPVGPYCVLDPPAPVSDTDKVPRVYTEEYGELEIGELDVHAVDVVLDDD